MLKYTMKRVLAGTAVFLGSGILFGNLAEPEAASHKLYYRVTFSEECFFPESTETKYENDSDSVDGTASGNGNGIAQEDVSASENVPEIIVGQDEQQEEDELILQSSALEGTKAIAHIITYANVREKPSVDAAIVGKLYPDCVGIITEEAGEWVCIESGNLKGFVKKDFLYLGEDAKTQIDKLYHPLVQIEAGILNVRAAADMNAAVLGEYSKGKTAEFLDFCGDWVKIKYSDTQEGYVYRQYVTVTGLPNSGETLTEEKARLEEEERLAAEAAKKAEEERLAAEAAKKAEEERLAAEAAKKAEEERLAAEAAKKAEEERLAAEAAKKAEEERLAAEAAKKAEEERLAAEAAKKAEEERLAAEAAKKAEEERLAAEAAKQEDALTEEEAAKKAEEERLAEEEAKKAEEERLAAEEAKKAEEERLAAEAAKKAEEERLSAVEAERTEKIETVIAAAMSALGKPYIWAGTDLTKGTDCSGLCYASYQKIGIKLQRSSKDMAKDSTYPSVQADREHLQRGDLIFYDGDKNGVVDHVALYLGDGKIIHASGWRNEGIVIANYNYTKPHSARRILP